MHQARWSCREAGDQPVGEEFTHTQDSLWEEGGQSERKEAETRAQTGEGRGEGTLHRVSVEGMSHT